MGNFFKCGLPVSGPDFYGRVEYLRKRGHQHSLLIGQRRIGKSSILREVSRLRRARSEDQGSKVVTLRCDGQSVSGDPKAFERLIAGPIDQLAQWAITSGSDFVTPDRDRLSSMTFRAAEEIFSSARDHGLDVLLTIDEIDALSEATRLKLRALVSETGTPILALSSNDPHQSGDNSGSAWFNFFSLKYVTLFSDAEAQYMLETISHKSGKQFSETECAVLMDLMGNFPFFLQIAGSECFLDDEFLSSSNRRGSAFRKALSSVDIQLLPHFIAMLNRLDEGEREVLVDIANGKSVSKPSIVSALQSMSLVTRNEDGDLRIFFIIVFAFSFRSGQIRSGAGTKRRKRW